jgi:uncharacterized protein (DUF58 family)
LDDQPLESGELTSMKRGSGQDLLALRDYHPNDDMRRVDWKATARSRNLIVREFSAEDDKRVVVFLDTRLPESERTKRTLRETIEAEKKGIRSLRSERFERAVVLTASLITHFTEEQADVTLVIDRAPAEGGIGSRHLHEDLRRLAVVEPEYTDAADPSHFEPFQQSLNTGKTTHIFLISAAPSDSIPEELRSAAVLLPY